MKIIQITDIHMPTPGELIFELDPKERIERCIADIVTHHSDADLCVITGDLSDNGDPDSYRYLRKRFADLPMPVCLLIGNHDHRENFRSVFVDVPLDESGFVQSALDASIGRLLFLDTYEAGTSLGGYCAKRMSWLKRNLAEARGRPCYLFMHHHPFPVEYELADKLKLVPSDEFAETLAGHNVRHIFFGHIHRPISGSWNGVPFSTLRGLNQQVWLDFAVRHGVPFSHEPPAYAIIFITEESVIVHTHDYMDDSPKFFYDPDRPVEDRLVRMNSKS